MKQQKNRKNVMYSFSKENRSKRIKHAVWQNVLLLLCVFTFFSSGCLLVKDLYRGFLENRANQQLAEQVHAADETKKFSSSGLLLRYEPLWLKNQDMAGWLSVEGTPIDYPVMHTPQEPEYYLRRSFDRNDAVSGSIFIGSGCTPNSSNVIVYGHHMKDGSMFGSLTKYADLSYAQEHSEIRFDTLKEERCYQVMAAFYSQVYSDREEYENAFRYYQYTDLSDPAIFQEYITKVTTASLYDTGVRAQYGDQLITLSTCSSHTQQGRFVVIARRLT